MEPITRIVFGQHGKRVCGVFDRCIKVDHAVNQLGAPDERIDGLPLGFTVSRVIAGDRGPQERRQRAHIDLDTSGSCRGCRIGDRLDDERRGHLLRRVAKQTGNAEIVDATMKELERLFPAEVGPGVSAERRANLVKSTVVRVPQSISAATPGRNKF